jgi:hypothetical protein
LYLKFKEKKKKTAYASEGVLELTINRICDAQTLNWGSNFVNDTDFSFLNVGKHKMGVDYALLKMGLLLGPKKIKTKCRKTDRETLNRGSTVYLYCKKCKTGKQIYGQELFSFCLTFL